jgi:hypothetical protein
MPPTANSVNSKNNLSSFFILASIFTGRIALSAFHGQVETNCYYRHSMNDSKSVIWIYAKFYPIFYPSVL